MNRSYSLSTLEKLIDDASKSGYEIIQVEEGVLGLGHMLLIAPTPGYYNFEIREEYRNQWSSSNTLRRFTKISKRIQKLMEVA